MAKSTKLSPNMHIELQRVFQAEPGIGHEDQTVARAGIIDAYMTPANTAVALIDRGLTTCDTAVWSDNGQWSGFRHLRQITVAGCKAIGRSMDEIVAWAWDQAFKEYFDREGYTVVAQGRVMTTFLPATQRRRVEQSGAGWNAYDEGAHGWIGSFPTEQEARDAAGLGPKFPKGTPEYAAYAAELKTELGKFARREAPYDGPVLS